MRCPRVQRSCPGEATAVPACDLLSLKGLTDRAVHGRVPAGAERLRKGNFSGNGRVAKREQPWIS